MEPESMSSSASFECLQSAPTAEPFSSASGSSIAPPWRRLLAYLADSFVLGFIGFAAGSVLSQRFSELGIWGHLVGLCAAVVYFSFFDSRLVDGQSPGKKWLKLRVVDVSGDAISVSRAIIRSVIFAVPCCLFGLDLPATRVPWGVSALLTVIVYGVGGATLYLVAFGKGARQGLHDLAVDSYVVNAEDAGSVESRHIGLVHWGILGLLLLAPAVATGVFERGMEKSAPFRQMNSDARMIEELPGVQQARVRDLLLHNAGSVGARKVLRVSLIRSGNVGTQEELADRTARLLLQNDRSARDYDQISILVFDGYDIGIASHWNHSEFVHSPGEWSQLVVGSDPAGAPISASR